MVTGSLQSFDIYKYYYAHPIMARHVSSTGNNFV
jgi:hypothetical protein